MNGKALFHGIAFNANRIIGVEIANNALAAFINKKRIAANVAVFNRSVTGKNFRVDIAEDHFGGGPVIP